MRPRLLSVLVALFITASFSTPLPAHAQVTVPVTVTITRFVELENPIPHRWRVWVITEGRGF
jgi:hypothetical protein